MEPINFILSSIIVYFGILGGILLIKNSPEEQKPLKRYFKISKIVLSIIISLFLLSYFIHISNYIFLSLTLILSILLIFKIKYATYLTLGVFLYLSSLNQNLFAIIASLIFLFGLLHSSLIYNEKNSFSLLSKNALFLLISNFLFILF